MPDQQGTSTKTDKGAPPPRWLMKAFTKLNVMVYRLSGGRLMNKLSGMPIVLIKMKGAKSGRQIFIPLMYVPHDKGLLLVASQGGAPKNPAWFHNLVKYPEIEISHAGKTAQYLARRVSDEEKAEFWPTCVKYYPPYEDYQQRTERNIPVFLCEQR